MISVPIEKNKKYIVDIIDNGFNGEGIAKIDGFIIFVPKAIKGEKCEILIVKVLSKQAYAKLINVIEKSDDRREVDCNTYQRCGGCDLRHIKYDATLQLKQQTVQNLVDRSSIKGIKVEETEKMISPYYYRNKAQYPVGLDETGEPAVGVFAQRTHTIIPIKKCMIQTEISQEIVKTIIEFIKKNKIEIYNETNQTGLFRHIVIRVGKYTNEIMCILVLNQKEFKQEKELVQILTESYPNIKSVVKNINSKNTNVILGQENITLFGQDYIEDKLGDYTFKISPMSFYQVNPIQAEKLYNYGIKMANLNEKDILCDLYCGTGTIGIFAAKHVKKVYGIEIVAQAIEDAKENAKINNVNNIKFITGDVEIAFDELLNKEKVKPTAIIVDPPRKGLDDKTIENILKLQLAKLVYISCNPSTMVRDAEKLQAKYEVKRIKPVDMFPFTKHVECCALLCRKNTDMSRKLDN